MTLIYFRDDSPYVLSSVYIMQGLAAMYIGSIIKSRIQWFIGCFYSAIGLINILSAELQTALSAEWFVWVIALTAIFLLSRFRAWPNPNDAKWFMPSVRVVIVVWTWAFGYHVMAVVSELFETIDGDILLMLMTLLYGWLYYYIGYRKSRHWTSFVGHGFILFAFIFALQTPLYTRVWEAYQHEWSIMSILYWAITLFTLVLLYIKRTDSFEQHYSSYSKFKHIMTMVMTFAFVTKLTTLLFLEADYVLQAIAMSVAWLLYGLICIFVGRWKQWSKLTVFGVLMMFVILIKLIFNDVPDISFTLRAMLFVGFGAIGLGVSRFLYRNEKDTKERKQM